MYCVAARLLQSWRRGRRGGAFTAFPRSYQTQSRTLAARLEMRAPLQMVKLPRVEVNFRLGGNPIAIRLQTYSWGSQKTCCDSTFPPLRNSSLSFEATLNQSKQRKTPFKLKRFESFKRQNLSSILLKVIRIRRLIIMKLKKKIISSQMVLILHISIFKCILFVCYFSAIIFI